MVLRKLAKILGAGAAALAVLVLLSMLALKLALDRVPEYQAEIKAWVHRQTGLHVRFAQVSPALRWYGPELSFRQLELRSADDRRVIARAARGRIGSDVWRLLTSGRLFAARIELDSPDIAVERAGPARFALAAAIPLDDARSQQAAFRLDDLPPGVLVIRNGRVTVTNWNRDLPRLVLRNVDVDVRRDADRIRVAVGARLPRVLGGEVRVAGTLRHLGDPAAILWDGNLRARDVSFSGWRRLLPAYLDHLRSGDGAFALAASGQGRNLARAAFDFSASKVVARSSDGTLAQFDRIGGDLRLTHEGERWTLLGRRVRASRAGRNDPPSQFDVTWRSGRGGALDLRARASYLRADNLLPLAGLLPQKSTRDRLIEIAPTGEWTDASLELSRPRSGEAFRFHVVARFHDAGFAPIGRAPGLRGLSGSVEGTESAGHVAFATRSATVEWPLQWPQPVPLDALDGTVYWSRTSAGLLIATPRIALANRDARIAALASLLVPASGGSPYLNLAGRLDDGDVADARLYLPRAKLHPKPLAWLDRAFVAGRVDGADILFRGPVRQFPFRDGSGLFLARLHVEHMTLDYGPGWPRIEDATANAEFRNQGLEVHVLGAKADGLAIDAGEADFADFRDAVLRVRAGTSGDASVALRFLRASPINGLAHDAFSAVEAKGPLRTDVRLVFPFKDFAHRRVIVHGQLRGVSVRRPGSPLGAGGLTGDFTVDGAAVTQARVKGRFLGGPVQVFASAPKQNGPASTRLRLRGVAHGDALAAALGLAAPRAISGAAAWRGRLTITSAPQRERSLRIATDLAGLAFDLPAPLAKRGEDPLPSTLDVRWPDASGPVVEFAVGPIVRGSLMLQSGAGGGRLERAAIAFGDATPSFSDAQPIDVRGRIARLDLGGWRRLLPRGGGTVPLRNYLHDAQLAVGEADYAGWSVRDASVRLAADGDRWRLDLAGPNSSGTVSWPAAGGRSGPWNFDFDRLAVEHASADRSNGAGDGAGDGADGAVDPASLPAMHFRARQLVWAGRDFGDVRADLSTRADGVNLDTLTAVGKSFRADAHGDWLGGGGGDGQIAGSLTSSDVEATLAALGYARVIAARKGEVNFDLHWTGAPSVAAFRAATGSVRLSLARGQVFGIKPGAGRVLGLASIAALPRRLALDFSDLTDKGLAFDTVSGSFDLRGGSAYTNDVLLKGPAAEIGLVGRIGLKAQDYDQTAVVTGSVGSSLPIAGALAGGPVVGAAVLLFTQVFKQPLRGLARGYYHITGSWTNPAVERIKSAAAAAAIEEGRK